MPSPKRGTPGADRSDRSVRADRPFPYDIAVGVAALAGGLGEPFQPLGRDTQDPGDLVIGVTLERIVAHVDFEAEHQNISRCLWADRSKRPSMVWSCRTFGASGCSAWCWSRSAVVTGTTPGM